MTTSMVSNIDVSADGESLSFEIRSDGQIDLDSDYATWTLDLSDFAREVEFFEPSASEALGDPEEWTGKVVQFQGVWYANIPALRRVRHALKKPWVEMTPEDLQEFGLENSDARDFVRLLRAATWASGGRTGGFDVRIPIDRAKRTLAPSVVDRFRTYFDKREKAGLGRVDLHVDVDEAGRVARLSESFSLKQTKGDVAATADAQWIISFTNYGHTSPSFELPAATAVAPGSVLAKRQAGPRLTAAADRLRATSARVLQIGEIAPSGKNPRQREVRRGAFDFAHDRGRLMDANGAYETLYAGRRVYRRPTFLDTGWRRCKVFRSRWPSPADARDPRYAVRLISRRGSSFGLVGRERVRGVTAVHYHGTINPGAVAGRLAADAWIDARGRLVRISVGDAGYTVRNDFYRFGTRVPVSPPRSASKEAACLA